MIDKVLLLWQAYSTKELLLIGSLAKVEDRGYKFKYENEALKAQKLGCFLPFEYTKDELYFSSLPAFFSQRMLTSKYNSEKFGINYNPKNELSILVYGNSIKNSDNFTIITEKAYQSINSRTSDKTENRVILKK